MAEIERRSQTQSVTTGATRMVESFLKSKFAGQEELEIKRSYSLNATIESLTKITPPLLAVAPVDREISARDRTGVISNTFMIDVAVLKKTRTDSVDEIDPLVELCEKVVNIFYMKSLEFEGIKYACRTISHEVIFDPDSMKKLLFFGLVRISMECDSRFC